RLHGREDRQVLLLGLQRGDLDGGHRRRDRVLVLGRPRGEGLLLCRPRADGGLERVHRLGGRLVLPLLAAAEAAGVLLLRPRSGRIGAAEYALVLLLVRGAAERVHLARAATGRTRPARVGAVRERVTRVGAAERTRRLARFRPAAERITAVAGERVAALAGERVDALAGERVGGVAVERVDLAEGVAAL